MEVAQRRTRDGRALEWYAAHRWTVVLGGAALAWSGALFLLVRSEYRSFELARFDLGNMVQAIWSTTQGRPLEITMAGGEQITRVGAHVDPILVLLTPLWMLVPSPLTLALAQVVLVSLGAFPVFWLARKYLGSETGAGLLALAYLASPWVAWTAYDAIHPKTLAIPLFLFAIWFLDEDRLGAFTVTAVLTAACGELMGVTIGALGLWYALARGRRREGLVIAALGTAWTFVALYVVVPAFSGGESAYFGLYESVGGSPAGILRTAVTDPRAIVTALVGLNEALYVFLLSAPLAGLFVLSPGMTLVALPQLVVNALADPEGPTDPRHHYIAAIIPFLFAGAAMGLARLSPPRRTTAAGLALGLSVLLSLVLGPWGVLVEPVPIRYELQAPASHADALRHAVAVVPDEAAVSSSNKVGSHLAARRHHFTIPILGNSEARAAWIVFDSYDPWLSFRGYPFLVERPQAELEAFKRRIEADPGWQTVFQEGGVYVFRRGE
jgi:uncharacterized membrane protein